ncbi:hypothetical protein M0R45_008185 [Rubus argutus]|uniref:Phytocyanin domain-containing protein n=1 Tax=Rubus argutus TaxID=59490 RepID=A0AAW1Y3R1_RUBAR
MKMKPELGIQGNVADIFKWLTRRVGEERYQIHIYLVGGDYTWKDPTWTDPPFDYQAWTDSIIFSPGDALDFNYDPTLFDVIQAGSAELYAKCSAEQNLGIFTSGDDEGILTSPGTYYFFDAESCKRNMKFHVIVN